jgi:RNA polymerase sigma-70 factor (ECF subfamily)
VLVPAVLPAVPTEEVDEVFNSLFEEHRHRLFSTALRLTGRRSDAEDLTAEAFLRAYRSLSGFDTERIETLQSRAWLSAILVNVWRNQLRSASRRPVVAPASTGEPDPQDGRPAIDAQVESRDDHRALASMLAQLPPRQREAVVLRYLGDLTIGDVAAAMGCPVGTVKSHISRGLASLRAGHPRDADRHRRSQGGRS